jgi:valyl-tRNA synthetase
MYKPFEFEKSLYNTWIDKKLFISRPDNRIPFTIVIPPPNVTGVLHMGHMLNNTIQDVLVRRARMNGMNACWVPGTDHASIATEAKVVQMLRDIGIKKSDLSRDEFLRYAWEWKDKYGGIILNQLKRLGASCDWSRTKFTMDESLSEAVIDVFVDLFNKGLIYRAERMVNWDPVGKTALSDEEVIFKEVNSKLFFIKYYFEDNLSYITIATTRPETIFADVALCVNPNDNRYKKMIGSRVRIPISGKLIPIIADEYVDMEFGTGCLKITPAHDKNDYEIGKKYNLPIVDILDDAGIINHHCEVQTYIGLDRFELRNKLAYDLTALDLIEKIDEYKNQVGTSERTGAIIEPKLKLQWWVDMKKFIDKNPQVLNDVMNDEIKFHPSNLKNTYKHWIDNIKDWCISRQLWWGHRIPAWYDKDGNFVVAKTSEEALSLFAAKGNHYQYEDIFQDDDVLDTWFSSWLWPITVFDGFRDPENEDIKYYYPTNDLVTAPEIMFFWVARMIMAGYEWRGTKPFSNVYYTGIVRDKQRRKMSKSLGNSPDPLDLIEKYGADGVRMGMLLCSPAGNDILFDESQIEQGRNFANKIWNAFNLISVWKENSIEDISCSSEVHQANELAILWMKGKLNNLIMNNEQLYEQYRLNEVLMNLYHTIWDDFCSWYLEMVKPRHGDKISNYVLNETVEIFDSLLRLLHPFMPFITEKIWLELKPRDMNDSICLASYPKAVTIKVVELSRAMDMISKVREFRNTKGISPKESFNVVIETDFQEEYESAKSIIVKLANINSINYVKNGVADFVQLPVGKDTIYIDYKIELDVAKEKEKLNIEIDYLNGFLLSVKNKLANEKFVQNAKPELIEKEQKKKVDAELKLEVLKKALDALKD